MPFGRCLYTRYTGGPTLSEWRFSMVLTIKTHGPAETAKGTAGALCRARSQTALFDPLTLAPGRRITAGRSAEWASLTASLYHDHPSTVL